MRKILAIFAIALCLAAQVRIPGPGGSSGAAEPNLHLRIDTLTSDGTWTAPADGTFFSATSQTVNAVDVLLIGAGGGGTQGVGSGGGGASSRCEDVSVTPAAGYPVQVGVSAIDANGEDTTFDTSACVAKGGLSGASGSAGGQASASTGDTKFNGGNGLQASGDAPGAGGAGTEANGSNTPHASAGGNGGNFLGGRGAAQGSASAKLYGAGGSSTADTGRAGADGVAYVIYFVEVAEGFPVRAAEPTFSRDSSNVTDHVVPLPPCTGGDLLLVMIAGDGGATSDLAEPSGWNTAVNAAHSTNANIAVFYRTASGSDTSVTIVSSGVQEATATAECWAGAQGAPTATSAAASSTNADPPSHSYGGGSGSHAWISFVAWDDGTATSPVTVTSPPSGYLGLLFSSATTFGSGASLATAHKHNEIETEDPGAFTSTSENWVAATISIPGASEFAESGLPLATPTLAAATDGATIPVYGSIRETCVHFADLDTTLFSWEAWNAVAGNREAHISSYNHTAGTFGPIVNAGIPMMVNDDHGIPPFVRDGEGYIHLFGGSHSSSAVNGVIQHAVTDSPNDLSSWSQDTVDTSGDHGYPKPLYFDGDLYVFSREGSSTGLDYVLFKSTSLSSGAVTWASPVELIDLGTNRVYAGNVIRIGAEMCFVAQLSNSGDSVRENLYFFCYDTSSGDIRNYSGDHTASAASLPIDQTEADANYILYDHASGQEGCDIPVWLLDDTDVHIFWCDGPTAGGPFNVLHSFDTGSGLSAPETVVSIPSRASLVAPVLGSDGTIHLYHSQLDAPSTRHEPYLMVRSAGGSWGSPTQILEGDARSISRFNPCVDATDEIRAMLVEYAGSSLDSAAGNMSVFLHGSGGFIPRP